MRRAIFLLFWITLSPAASAGDDFFFSIPFQKLKSKGEMVAIHEGKMVLAGTVERQSKSDVIVMRYNENGMPDISFGQGGRALLDIGNRDFIFGLATDFEGKIILGGYAEKKKSGDIYLARLNADGARDKNFGDNGVVVADFGAHEELHYLVLQADGKIVAGGFIRNRDGSHDFLLVRYLHQGKLDLAFGNNGKVVSNFGPDDRIYGVAMAPDGKIVVAGLVKSLATGDDCAVARYESHGRMDPSFDGNGVKILESGFLQDVCSSVAVAKNGEIVSAGFSRSQKGDTDFMAAKIMPDGRMDPSFGNRGIVKTDYEGKDDVAHAVSFLADGRIVLGGERGIKKPKNHSEFAYAVYDRKGALDLSPMEKGKKGSAASMAVDSAGKIFLAGHTGKDIAVSIILPP